MQLELTLNGRPVSVRAEPDETLLHVPPERLGLRSMTDGCAPEGSGGACIAVVDGHAVVSCAPQPAQANGKAELTLEAVAERARELRADAFVARPRLTRAARKDAPR